MTACLVVFTAYNSRASLCFKNDCIFIVSKYQRTLKEYERETTVTTLIKNVRISL